MVLVWSVLCELRGAGLGDTQALKGDQRKLPGVVMNKTDNFPL